MLNLKSVAEELIHPEATVERVAATMGTLGEREKTEYQVVTYDPFVSSVAIGMAEGKDLTAAPKYVKVYFDQARPVSLATAVPFCYQWRRMPSNPGATTYSYACPFPDSTAAVSVNILAELTDELGTTPAKVKRILFQRSVLQ